MKIFLRTGAWYSSETPHLESDLELYSLLKNTTTVNPKETVICNCKNEIAALNERIDILTKAVNDKDLFSKENIIATLKEETASEHNLSSLANNKPASDTSKKMVTEKQKAKKK